MKTNLLTKTHRKPKLDLHLQAYQKLFFFVCPKSLRLFVDNLNNSMPNYTVRGSQFSHFVTWEKDDCRLQLTANKIQNCRRNMRIYRN